MDTEKIGQLIKKIRKENHLTQKQFADKYGVTYQAVSKWENGKNLPDVSLIKEICKDFNMNMESMLEGTLAKEKKKKRKIIFILGTLLLIILLGATFAIVFKNKNDFEFKTISTTCKEFTLNGSIAYNNNQSSIYISNLDYCGKKDNTLYEEISCSLYEEKAGKKLQISTYSYNKSITLEDFLKKVTFKVDKYKHICNDYKKHNTYLEIEAKTKGKKTKTYRIDLKFKEDC